MSQDVQEIGDVVTAPLSRIMQERYLTYAVSVITDRALPDLRDGLKPVHRRILYAMHELKLSSTGAFRKSAKINGDVMGNYHPHGDSAIYDAMVRLAQGFSMRVPLVDGQGNFGNVDGDAAAAARYTEARMTKASEMMLEGIADDAVLMRPNYDQSTEEPSVLPAAFPNLLINGSGGIAVGMATNIPPHDPHQTIAACVAFLRNQTLSSRDLATIIEGPDFPTGGVLAETPEAIAAAYETGRGSSRLRSLWAVEDAGKAGWVVVITEIPYQTQKLRLVEKIIDLIDNKKLPLVADIRDESAEDVRIVIEPRNKSIDPDTMMASLFASSDLEIRFSMNMNVLLPGGVPKVCGLRECIEGYVEHRNDVLLRRSAHRLGKVETRIMILDGYLIAYLNLDEVIRIIRNASSPSDEMISRFGMRREQAEAILAMRLRSLRKLEEMEIISERDRLVAEKAELEALISDRSIREERLVMELEASAKMLGKPGRKTDIRPVTDDLSGKAPIEAFIEKEPVTIVLSAAGWVRSMRRQGRQDQDLKFRDGDGPLLSVSAFTTSDILAFASDGRVFTLRVSDIPGGRGFGEAIRMMIDLPQDASILAMRPAAAGGKTLLVSSSGTGMIVSDDQVMTRIRNGKRVMILDDGAAVTGAFDVSAGDSVASLANDGRLLVFPLSEVPEVTKGKGVWLHRGAGISGIISITLFRKDEGLAWVDRAGKVSVLKDVSAWEGRRAGAGKKSPLGMHALHATRC